MSDEFRVLHIEDDFADAMLLQHALCDAGAYDYELQVVRTVREARQRLARQRYDLIIADLRLPDSRHPNDTFAMIEADAKGTPIVVLTGSAGVDSEKFSDSGQARNITVLDKNEYFFKPSDEKSRTLLEKLRAAMPEDDDALII